MTKYYKVFFRNGFCGCDEDGIIKLNEPIEEIFNDLLESTYSFYYGDERFYDDDLEEEEQEGAYLEEVFANSSYEEITEEEYNKAIEDGEEILYSY
jgi:hypothetical protein